MSSSNRTGPDFHLAAEAEEIRRELSSIKNSAAFRLVQRYWALRESVLPPGSKRGDAYQALKKVTLKAVDGKSRKQLREKEQEAEHAQTVAAKRQPWHETLTRVSHYGIAKRVLIVAELSISSCRTYRVDHKVKMFEALGYEVTVTSWTDFVNSRHALQFASFLLLYRVPANHYVKTLIAEARRIGVPTSFDIDDLVFDTKAYSALLKDLDLSLDLKRSLLTGAELYREALALAGSGIASTPTIAEAMRKVVNGPVLVVPNGLDPVLEEIEAEIKALPAPQKNAEQVTIGYGSGTDTHDEDFQLIAPALLRVLKAHPNVRLALHGRLKIDKRFSKFDDRIFRVPFLEARDYYRALATFDISLAPLTEQVFNDAKSNIKFIEAAVFGVPTVASPSEPFRDAIVDGKNGRLAKTEQEWFDALSELVTSPKKRAAMGREARKTAQEYALSRIGPEYLRKVLPATTPRTRKKRVLVVNVLFSPMTFGGATVVAEQLATRLSRTDYEVAVVTGVTETDLPPISVVRYEALGLPVYGIQLPRGDDPVLNFKNENLAAVFSEILRSYQPDVVHFHSIQQLSASLVDACDAAGIPSVVTLHDAWWICQRQFMVTPKNEYCFQKGIDLRVCVQCVPDTKLLYRRDRVLRETLAKAKLLLAPSEFQRALYEANGFEVSKLRVNRNGVPVPAMAAPRQLQPSGVIRLAYLGGKAHHKGFFWLKEIIKGLPQKNFHLKIVDIHRKFGSSPFTENEVRGKGTVEFVDPFSPSDIETFYASVDVLLVPSLCKESFGLAVREALARNVWVISSDGGALSEEIVPGVNGDVVKMGDTEAFQAALSRVMNGQTQLEGYENPQRDAVRDYDAQAEELKGFLDEALGVSGRRKRAATASAAPTSPRSSAE